MGSVIQVIKNLVREKRANTVYGVGTAQDEVGLQSARTSSWVVDPDVGLTMEAGVAGDVPDVKEEDAQGKGDQYHEAVFRAYFVDRKNIGKMDELVHLAKSIDLPEKEAKPALELRTFEEAVDVDWVRSRHLGINAVPTFLIDNQAVVRAQPYEVLEEFLRNCGAQKRKNPDES